MDLKSLHSLGNLRAYCARAPDALYLIDNDQCAVRHYILAIGIFCRPRSGVDELVI